VKTAGRLYRGSDAEIVLDPPFGSGNAEQGSRIEGGTGILRFCYSIWRGNDDANWQSAFRFRLRTLLLAVTVLSVWLGLYVRKCELQRHSLQDTQANDGGLQHLAKLKNLEYLYM
jgi:hypothetical protein